MPEAIKWYLGEGEEDESEYADSVGESEEDDEDESVTESSDDDEPSPPQVRRRGWLDFGGVSLCVFGLCKGSVALGFFLTQTGSPAGLPVPAQRRPRQPGRPRRGGR